MPIPFAGRFLRGSVGDLALWSLRTGVIRMKSPSTGMSAEFRWGGRPGDVLVPGDYDGDGYDEIGVWQQSDQTWYWRDVPDGTTTQAMFGTVTSVPLPSDYNRDGRLDLAYWEPSEGKVYVSFDHGRSVGKVIDVPPHSIPIFANMY